MNGSRNPQRHGERSSLDALNRTIEGLEARIEGLMANGRDARGRSEERFAPRAEQGRAEQARYEQPPRNVPRREDPISEIMQRQRAIEGDRERIGQRSERRAPSTDHHAAAQQAHTAYGHAPARAEGSVEDIAKALVSLRQDLKRDIADGLEREMQSLRSEIRGIRQMAEGRGGNDDVRAELARLSTGISQLGRQAGQASGQTDGLRVEFDELRSVLDGLAREDSVRRMEDRWSGVEQKLSVFDQSRDDELVALAYRLDELKAQINTMSATPAIRALEDKIESVVHAVDMLGRQHEPDSGRFVTAVASQFAGLDTRLDEISRAIAAAGRMQQSPSADHAMMQRLEGRIADLADQLDIMAHRPAPEDHGLGMRIEALASRIEDLSNERATLRLEERIEQLSQMLEQGQQAAPTALLGGDELAYYLSDISRKIDALDQGSVNNDLADRLDALARRIDNLDTPVGSPFQEERFSHLEGRLSAIADRLDATSTAPAGDHEALRGLEAQIAHLSTLISAPAPSSFAAVPPDVENRLATIEDYMATNDDYIVEAARQAAEAVMEAYRHAAPAAAANTDMAAIAGLAGDLRALEELTRSSEDRTARTFDALHDTLVQIAGRLEQLDAPRETFGRREAAMPRAEMPAMDFGRDAATASSLAGNDYPFEDDGFGAAPYTAEAEEPQEDSRFAEIEVEHIDVPARPEPLDESVAFAGETQEQPKGGLLAGLKRRFKPAGKAVAVKTERQQIDPTPSIDAADELAPEEANQLLEPGSGVPDVRRILERVRAGQASGNRAGSEGEKADFIAAARRAAKLAAEEADTISRVAPAKKSEKPARGEKPASALSRHRRPILLAVGAVLLAIMSYPLVNTLIRGDDAPVIVEQTAETRADARPAGTATAKTAETPVIEKKAVTKPAGAERGLAGTDKGAAIETPRQTSAGGADMLATPALTDGNATAGFEPVTTPDAAEPLAGKDAKASAATAPVDQVQTAAIVVPDAITPASLAKAAGEGDPLALFEIGARYTEGRGVAADLKEAARWYELAAARGFAPAEYRLANLYEKGQGVAPDIDRARKLYETAAAKGNASAMHNLAVLLATGLGSEGPDFDAAAKWFQKASELGVRDSQFNLAILYARGNGVKPDIEESYKWFAIAARDGDQDAAQKRDEVANAMKPEQLASAKAKMELWKPQPLDEKANSADLPDEWVGNATKTASVDMKKAIRNIQAILNNNGFNAGTPDGEMGKKTVTAIKAFQKSVGQKETGEIDDALVTELLKRNKQPG
ncbi:peptidoglycan-binding protein [Shinella zoogloeoides]|uniref:Peptidoglycan-binding protein n=1 Tax=Shinella zoogloeoides TaxID=352475 RepID=A0A6N8TGR9_SHIZO|nr:peptidoglycan-binding protein [Shinella zoogloeoides]MXO02473.1 peptidoglycan-binding protein [Shinella zoogloeoides]UEX81930.1 peptidoglycan-binding protein [Shinella zoogloeoides]